MINAYLNGVNITTENTTHDTTTGGGAAAIKFGNGYENVNLTVVNSTINTTADGSRKGISSEGLYGHSKGTITVINSTITTPEGAENIRSGSRLAVPVKTIGCTLTNAPATATNTEKGVEMTEGASVRFNNDPDERGIRFVSTISGATVEALEAIIDEGTELKYGTLITVTEAVNANGGVFDPAAIDALGWRILDIAGVMDKGVTVDEETGEVEIRAALIGLYDYTRAYSSIAYVEYTVNGVAYRVYSDYVAKDNSRSIAEVAYKALNDTADEQDGEYIFHTEDGKYSPYTNKQRDILETLKGTYTPNN